MGNCLPSLFMNTLSYNGWLTKKKVCNHVKHWVPSDSDTRTCCLCKPLITWRQANSCFAEVKILCLNIFWILKYSLDARQLCFCWSITSIMPFHLVLALWDHSITTCLTSFKKCWPMFPWTPLSKLHHLERISKMSSILSANSHC